MPVGAGHLQTFLCERKNTFFLRVLSMYLTDTTDTSQFSGFFALFGAGRRFPKSPYLGVDGTAIKIAWLFVPVFVAACEESCNKSRPFQNVLQSV